MSEIEVFLDETPGETRGIIARDGRFEYLLIQRDDDPPQNRLGARCVGRVLDVEAAFNAAFVDLGVEGPKGFLPLAKGAPLRNGDRIEVEVVAEPRESKGPTLRLIGAGEGQPRLLTAGPDVRAQLADLAPGAFVEGGVNALQASWDAQEEALGQGDVFAEWALDLSVQRTRALVAVDIDYAHLHGRDARKGRQMANAQGLKQAARLIRLKNWGGLVAIDLIGTGLDADSIVRAAKAAFAGDPDVAFGPLSRFGLLQLSLPWRRTPVEERLYGWGGRLKTQTYAIDTVRRLRMRTLQDRATPRFVARCAPDEAAIAAPLAARLGPRVGIVADPDIRLGHSVIEES